MMSVPFDVSDAPRPSGNPVPHVPHTELAFQNLASATLLPRLSQPVADALNRVYAWHTPLECQAGGMVFLCRWDFSARPAMPACTYRFQCGPATGWLLLEALAEHTLIGDAASDAVPADLRYALAADALTPWLNALEKLTRRPVELLPAGEGQPPTPNGGDWLRFRVTRHAAPAAHDTHAPPADDWQCRGALHFDDERFITFACPETPPATQRRGVLSAAALARLPVPLSFRLGTTMMSPREMRGISRGDIISIEQWSSAGKALVCTAVVPGAARLGISGKVGGTQIVIDKIQELSVTDNDTAALAAPGDGDDRLQRLETMDVAVTFELDKRVMTLGELQSLHEGHIIELEQPLNQSRVRILANGALVGHGHLIAVGNKLGVRVGEFGANAHDE